MVLQSIPFMASGCSLVRRAGRLHFIGRHIRDRHHNAPQFEVGGARHRRGHGVAHRTCLSRVVTAALLSEVAEVVTLPDLRSKVPEDRVRNRDMEEEVGQH
jgi:hypothetical protein